MDTSQDRSGSDREQELLREIVDGLASCRDLLRGGEDPDPAAAKETKVMRARAWRLSYAPPEASIAGALTDALESRP